MDENNIPRKIKALPTQLVDVSDGLLIKRGCTEFKINGEDARIVVETILSAATEGSTQDQICELFPVALRPTVTRLIEQFIERRILMYGKEAVSKVRATEDSIDLFYWQFGKQTELSIEQLNSFRFDILGVTNITRQLVTSLDELGLTNFRVIDYPLLRNRRLFDNSGAVASGRWPASLESLLDYEKWNKDLQRGSPRCIVATSDFGYSPAISQWNEFCIGRGCHYLPVVLSRMIGYIGPLVIPGETACLECLQARQNSHMQAPLLQRASEKEAFEGQMVTGFHPAMTSILGSMAAFELTRFYGGIPSPQVGMLIEVDVLGTSVKARKVLKLPRCLTCSNLNTYSSVNPYNSPFMPPTGDGL